MTGQNVRTAHQNARRGARASEMTRDTTPASALASQAKSDTQRVTISISGRPLGANQVAGVHWNGWVTGMDGRRARLYTVKRDWMEQAHLAWLEAGRPVFPDGASVFIRAVFGTGNRRDASNYAGAGSVKWVLDALTDCECWPDDSQRYLDVAGVETVYRRDEWAVEIVITERSDG